LSFGLLVVGFIGSIVGLIVGSYVVGSFVVGSFVVGSFVVGSFVVGSFVVRVVSIYGILIFRSFSLSFGLLVVGFIGSIVGLIVGSFVVGSFVVGSFVVGSFVVGSFVVGSFVVGSFVVRVVSIYGILIFRSFSLSFGLSVLSVG
jgi:hypothetical protein